MKKLNKKQHTKKIGLLIALSDCLCSCNCQGACNCAPIPTHAIQSGVVSEGKDSMSSGSSAANVNNG